MEEPPDVFTLVAGLTAESDSARKYAVFKLKSALGDMSWADEFIRAGGLPALRQAVLDTNGNTQAYALGSLDALLELDLGWECCDSEVLEKVGWHTQFQDRDDGYSRTRAISNTNHRRFHWPSHIRSLTLFGTHSPCSCWSCRGH